MIVPNHNRDRLPVGATLVWIAYVLVLVSGGCKDKIKDVTNDPSKGNFATVVGVWKVKSSLTLMDIGGHLYLSATGEHYSASTRDIAVLPIGTELRIDRLVLESTFENDILRAKGSLVSGPYAGKSFDMDTRLFVPNSFFRSSPAPATKLIDHWQVAPDKLGQ